jgi:UTP--glucose-1-phosphate uridylyltransferase
MPINITLGQRQTSTSSSAVAASGAATFGCTRFPSVRGTLILPLLALYLSYRAFSSGSADIQEFAMPKVRKAVITAAGRGTRQYPASSAVQKEMFTLVDRDGITKPVIQIIGEEALGSGIEEICIITQPGEESAYRDYFRRLDGDMLKAFGGKEWAIIESEKLAAFGERLHFAEQASAEGFGHAVYQARKFAGDDPFLLLLGDHVYISATKDRCALQLIRVFEEFNPAALTAVQPTLERELHLFGTIRGRPVDIDRGVYQAELIIEKPDIQTARDKLMTPGLPMGNYLSHFGMHIFSPAIFDSLEHLIQNNIREKNEFQLTAAQEHLRAQSNNYLIATIQGQRFDTGLPYGLMETQLALALNGIHRTQICESIARILAVQARV